MWKEVVLMAFGVVGIGRGEDPDSAVLLQLQTARRSSGVLYQAGMERMVKDEASSFVNATHTRCQCSAVGCPLYMCEPMFPCPQIACDCPMFACLDLYKCCGDQGNRSQCIASRIKDAIHFRLQEMKVDDDYKIANEKYDMDITLEVWGQEDRDFAKELAKHQGVLEARQQERVQHQSILANHEEMKGNHWARKERFAKWKKESLGSTAKNVVDDLQNPKPRVEIPQPPDCNCPLQPSCSAHIDCKQSRCKVARCPPCMGMKPCHIAENEKCKAEFDAVQNVAKDYDHSPCKVPEVTNAASVDRKVIKHGERGVVASTFVTCKKGYVLDSPWLRCEHGTLYGTPRCTPQLTGDGDVWVKIVSGEFSDLDKWSKTDAFVKVFACGMQKKTKTKRNKLTPTWNQSWTLKNVGAKCIAMKLQTWDEDYWWDDDALGTHSDVRFRASPYEVITHHLKEKHSNLTIQLKWQPHVDPEEPPMVQR